MKKCKYPLLIADCVMHEKNMYFFAQNYNALYAMNLKNEDCVLLDRIPNEKFFDENLIEAIHYFKGKLILTPKKMVANKVWIYDIKTNEWNFIDVDFENIETPQEKVAYSTIYYGRLILVGCYYNGIIEIDLNTYELKYHRNIFDSEESIHALFCCKVFENHLLIPSPTKNQIMKVDLDSYNYEIIYLENENCLFSGIVKGDKKFWLSPRKTSPYIIRWNGKDEYVEYQVPDEIKKNGEYIFARAECIDGKVYMTGEKGKKTLVFSDENYNKQEIINNSFTIMKCFDKNFLLQDYNGNVLCVVNGQKYEFCMKKTTEELGADNINVFLEKELVCESTNANLPMLIESISKI